MTVDVATSGDTATSDDDFTAVLETLTFTAGETQQTVTVATVDDDLDEADETFTLRLSNAAAATLPADPTATGTIRDTDGEPSVQVVDDSADEGDAVAFTVELSAASGKTVTVDWAVSLESGDTAQADDFDDFPPAGTVTFNPGDNTAELIVESVIDDTLDEDDETFTLTLSNPTNATLAGNASQTMTLRDNDAEPTLRVAAASATEGREMAFAVTLSTASGKDVTVDVATSVAGDDTAEAETDFTPVTTTLTFTAGQTQKIVTVLTVDDTLEEDNETFTLTLWNPENATLQGGGTELSRTGTINDDDGATLPEVHVEDASAPEGKDVAFKVTLSAESTRAVTVDVATSVERGDTAKAGTDFTAVVATTLTFEPDAETEKTVTVATVDDEADEADETFTLTLWNAMNATLARDRTATGTIRDDDDEPALSVAAASATEGKAVAFTVTLSAASGKPVTVDWAVSLESGNTAEIADFRTDSGRLIIDAGKTTGTVSVATTDDTTDEEDEETFTLTLLNPSNATLATDRTATGTILDNDDPPALSVEDASASEDEAVAFTVTLSAASSRQVTVDWAVSLEGNTAEIDDFTADSGALTIDAGDTTGTVSVVPTDDTIDEEDEETFTLTLLNPSNATLATDRTATGTIYDNDDPPMLRVEDANATEGKAVGFTVELLAASVRPVTVDWEAAAQTEDTAGADDFEAVAATTLTFAPNETEKTVTVETADDGLDEYRETFTLTLSSARNATLQADRTATGAIDDNDEAPVLSVATDPATEGSDVAFRVTLSAASAKDVTVAWAAAALDAEGDTAGADDFTAASGTLIFAASETEKTVTVKTADDGLDEEDEETFTLTLSNASNATLATDTVKGTITDDDAQPVLRAGGGSATEGSDMAFTVSLTRAERQASDGGLGGRRARRGGRHGGGRNRLHGGFRDADLHGRRQVEDRHGEDGRRRARRGGRRDLHADAVEADERGAAGGGGDGEGPYRRQRRPAGADGRGCSRHRGR